MTCSAGTPSSVSSRASAARSSSGSTGGADGAVVERGEERLGVAQRRSSMAPRASTIPRLMHAPEKLLLAAPRGYCAGVDRAVQTVERALELYGAPVYVRKEIVHNKHVVETLRERGAIFVDELDDSIPEGAIDRLLRPRRLARGPRRRRAPRAADDRRDLPAGDQGPPRGAEVRRRGLHDRPDRPRRPRGGRGHDGRGARRTSCSSRPRPTSTRSRSTTRAQARLHLADDAVGRRDARRSSPACASASRTSPGPRTDDICYATTNRQAAVKQMAAECDLVLVIGSHELLELQPAGRRRARPRRRVVPDRRRRPGPGGVARGRPRRRHLLRRQRARGARRAPRRVLPRPRHRPTSRSSRSCARTCASCCPSRSVRR